MICVACRHFLWQYKVLCPYPVPAYVLMPGQALLFMMLGVINVSDRVKYLIINNLNHFDL